MTAEAQSHLPGVAQERRTACERLGSDPGKQMLQRLLTAELQPVCVSSLRNRATMFGESLRKDIAIDDGHVLEGIRQDPRGQQPGDACADDHSMSADAQAARRSAVARTA